MKTKNKQEEDLRDYIGGAIEREAEDRFKVYLTYELTELELSLRRLFAEIKHENRELYENENKELDD